jgi:hypothetical protein
VGDAVTPNEALVRALCAIADACQAEVTALSTLVDALLREEATSARDDFVDARRAVEYGLSARAFRDAIARGELTGFQVGRRRVARAADVRAFVERHPIAPKPTPLRSTTKPADSVDAKIQRLLDAGRLRSIKPR